MYEIEENSEEILPKEVFAKRFQAFKDLKTSLSFSKIEKICGNKHPCSRATIHRLMNNKTSESVYMEALPILEKSLEKWMVSTYWRWNDKNYWLDRLFPHRRHRTMIINRCELTSRAVKFFGLTADPFDVDRVPGEEEFFTNNELDEIASRIRDAALYKKFICVTGGVGTGKTSMKIRVARELENLPQNVRLLYPEFFDMNAITVPAISSYILDELEIKQPRASASRNKKIKEFLSSLERDDVRVSLVFDECHRLNDKVLVSLKNFWEMTNGAYSRLLGIILFGQPKFVQSTLREVRFREIAERVQIIEMPSLEATAQEYLAHRLQVVDGDIENLFDAESIKRICSVATTPLALGNLANTALMEAYKLEEKQVESSMLKLPDTPMIRNIRNAA